MKDDDNLKIVILIILIIVLMFSSIIFTKYVVESDMPLWAKIWLLY